MPDSERARLSWLFEHAPQAASAVAIMVGILVLFGWAFDLALLKSVFSGLAAMKANTALGFILAGVALWNASSRARHSLSRIVSQVCAASVLLLGLLVLAEYLSGRDFGIDQFLIREATSLPGDIPGRMAVSTAASFASLGAALVLLSLEKREFELAVHALVIGPVLVAGAALVSYGYDIEAFLRTKLNYTPMAIHTAALFVLLGFGIMNARPDYPFRRIMTSDNVAGSTARRLLPATIGLQLVMGWLLLKGLQAGYLSEAVGLAFFAVANIGGLSALIQWNAARLYQADSQRQLAERALQNSEKKYRELVDNLQEGIWAIGADARTTFVNPRMAEILGYTVEEMLGRHLFSFMDERAKEIASRNIERRQQGIKEQHEFEFSRKDGTRICASLETSPIYDEQGNYAGALAGVTDITERKRAEEEVRALQFQLREEATRDALTGLYNRRYLEETLKRELVRAAREGHPLSILMVDIDHFKQLNDTYGHQAGDKVLRATGSLLQQHARTSDIPCRYGGEEFVVVLPDMSLEAAWGRAEQVRRDFADLRIAFGDAQLAVAMSIGVSVYPGHGKTADELICAADKALYEAKQTGRNKVCVASHHEH